ncbi:kinetochore-associated protein 1-like [Babylonia areolata]|uniref:kinetochore-associated protein 1-like n=1 Tax=Babylonia areolata TaxID=304850 RepID=UPI003FD6559F
MLNWDQVQTEFAGDETTNFGPRKETGTALYQVDTVATISTQNEVAGKVDNLVSAAFGDLVCVGVDHNLSIFKDSQHIRTTHFENLVEDCTWSPDGSLLLVVDSGGKLHLFNAESLQYLFSYTLVPVINSAERAFHRIVFRSDEETESCDLILLSATGLLFIVKGFSPSAFTQGTDTVASVVQEQLQFRKVQTGEAHTDVTWDAVPLGAGTVITVGGGDSVIAVWMWQDNCIALDDCVGDIFQSDSAIINAKLASNDKLLYCLDQMNRISIWLVPELVMLSCMTPHSLGSETSISDFLLLETQGTQANSTEGTCLVLLLNDLLSSTLQMWSVENGSDVYTLQLGSRTSLARCTTTQESLYVAEGTTVLGDPEKVSTVRLRCLTETDPETRLQRILHKNRFEEALQFARLFNLSTELVYTAQMNQLLEQLSPWNVVCYEDNQVSAMLEQLWTSVHNVKDFQLVAENCMRAALPSFSDTWKLLQLCQTKMQSKGASNETERHQILQMKVLDLQNRLMTYKLAYGSQLYSADSWTWFQQANLLHLVCREVAQHQPHVAILVWRRHCEEWRGQISVEIVQHFLQVVAERLPAASVIGWLTDDLLPYIARFLPKAMDDVVQWAVQRATSMELVEKAGWPQNAIGFLETLSQSVNAITEVNFTATKDTAVETTTKTEIDVHSVLSAVQNTLTMLYQLQDLLKYNMRLSVKQFQEETRETLAFRMLDQVVMVELMKPTLEKYITPYIRAHCLDQDYIFATYIKDLLKRLGQMRSYTGQSAWEDKVLAIVSFIHNPKEKCCAVLNVIKHAPLPWGPDIGQLVEDGFKIQHPLVQELKKAKKIVDVRLLMQEYGLKSSTVPSQSQAERLAIFIVEQDKSSSLRDALRVLKVYINNPQSVSEIYLRYANILIRSDRVLEYIQVLKSMDWSQAKTLGERVVSLAEICLGSHIAQPAIKTVMDQHKERMTLAAVLTLQHLLPKATDPAEIDELTMQLKIFSSLLALQREYKMMLSVLEYCDEVNRGTVFATFTQQYLKEKKPFLGSGNLTVLYRLADLLQLQREAVQGELAVVEARAGNWNAVFFLCRELLRAEASAEVGQVLHRVVSALLHLQQGQRCVHDDGDSDPSADQEHCRHLPIFVEKLADRAVVICDAKMLASCLELSKSARLWRQVGSQCEAAEEEDIRSLLDCMDSRLSSQEPLQTYTLDTVYMDEALVMNSSIALPLAAASLAATSAFVRGGEDSDEEDVQSSSVQNVLSHLQPIVSHLRENSHLQLALRFLIITTSSLRQSLLEHNMGFPQSSQVKAWHEAQQTVMQEAEKRGVQLFHTLMSSLVLKVLSAHRVDNKMVLACLLSTPRKVSIDCLMKSIASCNFNFRKLGVIASVGLALGHLLRESKLISTCQELEINAAWGVRLGKLKISFKEAFQGGMSAKHEVIAAMAGCEQVDVRMVAEFSVDFKMEAEDSLLVYLEKLLKTSPEPWQLSKARAVVAAVEARDRRDFLLNKLRTIYKQTSPYEYEVIEFLLGEMNRLDSTPQHEKGLKLVFLLKMYTRRTPPSDTELTGIGAAHEHKEECGDGGDLLPQGSAQRIPLHPLLEGEPWKIITPELDADSVPQWLEIAQLLELSTDEVYLIAVQNIVRRHVSHTTTSTPGGSSVGGSGGGRGDKGKVTLLKSWQVSEVSLHMLEGVQQLLNCVKSCEMALACANWVVRELPMGGDKVLGLQGCVEFARRWYQICEQNTPQKEKARAALVKFQKVLRKVLTEQALYVHGLTDPQLLQLVSSPGELITRLTEHPAVVADADQTGSLPDVFSTLQKVCEVNELDTGEVLISAMTKWLLASDSSQDMDTTLNLSFSNLKMTEENLQCGQNDSIKRLLYFLYRGPRPQMLKFLIDTVQTGEAENTSHVRRMNSLYCLLQISDDADLHPLGLSCQSIREMLRVSCYLTQLEELHIQHSVHTLSDCNKTGLVKSIWRIHKHQKSAVKLAAALCLDYKLYDRQQWAAMLQQMITLHMSLELEHVLQRLHSVPVLWSLPVFVSAWQAVLVTPLTKVSLPLADDQIKSCLHTFNLLQSCPIPGQINLSAMKQHFEHLELDVCAAACLMMDPSVSHTDVQEALSQDPSKLIEQSYALTKQGLNLPSAFQVREVVFQHVLEQGDYHLIPQQALQEFVLFIVLKEEVDGCLLFALSNNMLDQAEGLMELYFQHHPEYYDELVDWCENSGFKMDSKLQAYTHMKNLV